MSRCISFANASHPTTCVPPAYVAVLVRVLTTSVPPPWMSIVYSHTGLRHRRGARRRAHVRLPAPAAFTHQPPTAHAKLQHCVRRRASAVAVPQRILGPWDTPASHRGRHVRLSQATCRVHLQAHCVQGEATCARPRWVLTCQQLSHAIMAAITVCARGEQLLESKPTKCEVITACPGLSGRTQIDLARREMACLPQLVKQGRIILPTSSELSVEEAKAQIVWCARQTGHTHGVAG